LLRKTSHFATGKRTDPPPTKGAASGDNTPWTINMQLDLKIEGVYKNLEIYWRTCVRIDGTSGVIPTCTNKKSCNFPTVTKGNSGGPYVTSARIFWLSCEDKKWKKQAKTVGGGYTFDGNWQFK
jgi:hypothetical protein